MFPIIGPTAQNSYTVTTPHGECTQDQHGLLRELQYILSNHAKNTATYKKIYQKDTIINSKYSKDKSRPKELFWNYNFQLEKSFRLTNKELIINFEIQSEKGMPFMFGYHPAFKLSTNKSESIQTKDKLITLLEIQKRKSVAYPLLNTTSLNLINENKYNIEIQTTGFNNFILWSESDNMICIEPITQYPDLQNQKYSTENMRLSSGLEKFQIKLKPYNS
jgi:galactose mutarotase-like enzyme